MLNRSICVSMIMSRHIYIFKIESIMKLFNTLLEIKTGKKNLPLKAIFIENAFIWNKWSYFIYHYEINNNTFYINDLEYPWSENRIDAISIIEHIATKAYRQEINSYWWMIKKVLQYDKPKIYCFYRQSSWLLIMDKMNLKVVRWKKWNILRFKNPTWNIHDSNYVKVHKLKKNLLKYYSKKDME